MTECKELSPSSWVVNFFSTTKTVRYYQVSYKKCSWSNWLRNQQRCCMSWYDHSSIGMTIEMSDFDYLHRQFSIVCTCSFKPGDLTCAGCQCTATSNPIWKWTMSKNRCSELVASRLSWRKVIQRCKNGSRHAQESCNLLCCAFCLRTSRPSWPLLPSFGRRIRASPRRLISSLTRPFTHWLVSRTSISVSSWVLYHTYAILQIAISHLVAVFAGVLYHKGAI